MRIVIEVDEAPDVFGRDIASRLARVAAADEAYLEVPGRTGAMIRVSALTGVVDEQYGALLPYIAPPLEAK